MTTRRFPLEPVLESVHEARLAVREVLVHCGIGDTALAELVTSELVSNAIRHGEAPLSVVVRCAGQRGRVEVHDASPRVPTAVPASTADGASSTHGLAIVDAFTPAWGVQETPGGKAVWFQVDGGRRS